MGIVSYVGRRALLLIPIFIGVTFITFILSRVVVPDPARAWAGIRASADTVAALGAQFHLKDPLYVQYYYYLTGLLSGNWGTDPSSGRPVLADIVFLFPTTLELALVSILMTILIGIPLGVLAALYHNRKLDNSIRFFYLSGFSSPPFFVALVILLIFGYFLRMFPTQGELSSVLVPPAKITGMYIVDALLTANWKVFLDATWHVILPAAALTLTYMGVVVRVTRASMLEVLQKDFVRSSYAKGLSRQTVLLRHALRNALIPTTTVLGLLLGSLLGGTVVIETIFQWPGIGYYATQAIVNLDFPAVMGVATIFTIGVVIANLIADVFYAFLNPRIRI